MMNKAEVIENAKNFACDFFKNDHSGHDFAHTLRVYDLAYYIAEQEGADVYIVGLAALLHDVDDHKLSPDTATEKNRARKFLYSQGLEENIVGSIVDMIRQVSFSQNTLPPDTLEGKCVQDADRLDAMGAIGIARTFAFGGSHGRALHDPKGKDATSSIAHFYDKLLLLKDKMNTSTARKLAEGRDRFLRIYLDEFISEWNGER